MEPQVSIIMGSTSDLPVMEKAAEILLSTNNLMISTFLSKSLLKISCERCIDNEALEFAFDNLWNVYTKTDMTDYRQCPTSQYELENVHDTKIENGIRKFRH